MRYTVSAAAILVLTLVGGNFSIAEEVAKIPPLTHSTVTPELLAVSSRLGGKKFVRSLFKQGKKLKVLKRPLLSTGHFLFSVESGLYWQIDKPLYSAIVVTDDAIYEKRDGRSIVLADTKSQPLIGDFASLFKYLFSGEIAQLENNFEVDFSGDTRSWKLLLKPKSTVISQLFEEILVSGGEHVDTIFLKEVSGDFTELTFFETISGDEPLSHLERQYFE